MSNFQKIISSFSVRDTLNPKIWENPNDPKEATLKPKIRKGLMKIAEEFVDDLGDDVFVEDVFLMVDLKKKIFNSKHNIKIYGYDVEVYAQGESDEHHSDGVFSIMNDEWIHKPEKKELKLNMSVLKNKIKCWTEKIDDAVEDAKSTGKTEELKKLKEKLKDYRQSGLNKDGEFSYENLVFKFLRRSGHIGKLFDEKTKIKDKELSIEIKSLD